MRPDWLASNLLGGPVAEDSSCRLDRGVAGEENFQPEHIAEAISYRKLDRKL